MSSKYSCEKCGKGFAQKSHYDMHMKKKKPCENNVANIQNIVDAKVKEAINDLNIGNILKITALSEKDVKMPETFKDLYEFLQDSKDEHIMDYLNDESGQESGYKQETLTKLFGSLNLIDQLKGMTACKGNFNKNTIQKQENYKNVFYKEDGNLITLKGNAGDSSDFTMVSNENEKHLLIMSSKSLTKETSGGLDIEKMSFYAQKYISTGYTITYGFVVKNKIMTDKMIRRTHESSKDLSDIYNRKDTIVIDWNDLNQAYHMFKIYFQNTNIKTILNSNKKPLCLKMHQRIGVMKTLRMKSCDKKKILWGHIQRSGKSYIIGGCIIEDSKNKENCNYLVITTAPNETINQQIKVFEHLQFEGFNVISLNGKNKEPVLGNKNIIVCSKQFLQSKTTEDNFVNHIRITSDEMISKEKTKNIAWLKKIEFDMRFLDESHNGGTTELAQKTLEFYGKDAFTVQITATYSKPINDYNIPRDCWILWDLEDIKLCKNIEQEGAIERLVEKHGEEFKNICDMYSKSNIIEEYSKYPELWLLTDEIKQEIMDEIVNDTKDNNYGWSPDACFLLKQGIHKDTETGKNILIIKEEFQNEAQMLKIWYRIFGKYNKFGIPDKDYPDDIVFMKRIEKICKNPEVDSRFIGDTDEPMIIMAFLPQIHIDKISNATITLLQKHNVIPDYEIISINSKTTSDPKQTIEDARIKARNSGKKGVLVLSGKQCSLGVSIDNCDIVLLLNNNTGFDMIYQMMFRCMTEGDRKKCGFVIDLNIHRVIETSIIDYACLIKSDCHPKEATKYILQERLINLNGDHWMPSFGNDVSKITALSENVYNIYSSNTENALKHFLDRLRFKECLLTKEDEKIFNAMFSGIKPTKEQKALIEKLLAEEEPGIKKGIEKTGINPYIPDDLSEISDNASEEEKEKEKEEQKINYMDILKHIIPLICILTIHNEETSFVEMFNFIESDKNIYTILIDQTKSWWGNNIDSSLLKRFINMYIKYMKGDKETNQIIRTVKELFMKNIKNSKELSNLIDKYLIPQELEKKSNAEVSTPFRLRQEMLDKMPLDFWKSVKRVFEPCAGKGGFLIDIIDRFMIGLKDAIPDEKLRYKTIVEECLYFSDINPTNIFICKLLIDPYNEYNLNYNEGNTLELNITEKWGIEGFDAVIGNPPYQNTNNNKGSGNTLWNVFVETALNVWLVNKGYLLYVHPRGWRQIKNKTGELMRKKQIIYLNMNNLEKGLSVFKCSTDFDYYLIENTAVYKKTIINDYDDKEYEYLINDKLQFIPNHNIDKVYKMIDVVEDNGFINDQSSYEPRKSWMCGFKTAEFKYPCVYSINAKNEVSSKWSSVNNKGHFGVSKFIFSNGNGYVKDSEGTYGLTQWAYAFKCSEEDMNNVEKAFNSEEFNTIVDAINLTSNKYNYNVMKLFKKDFWKEFL